MVLQQIVNGVALLARTNKQLVVQVNAKSSLPMIEREVQRIAASINVHVAFKVEHTSETPLLIMNLWTRSLLMHSLRQRGYVE